MVAVILYHTEVLRRHARNKNMEKQRGRSVPRSEVLELFASNSPLLTTVCGIFGGQHTSLQYGRVQPTCLGGNEGIRDDAAPHKRPPDYVRAEVGFGASGKLLASQHPCGPS